MVRKATLSFIAFPAMALLLYGCLGVQGGDVVQTFQGLQEATATSPTTVSLRWITASHTIRYDIYSSSSEEPIGNTQTTSFDVTGLQANHPYTFAVSAIYDDGREEGISVEKNVVTWPEFEGVQTANVASSSQVDLSWDYTQTGPVFYVYQNMDSAPADFSSPVATTQSTTIRVGNLKGSTTYYFVVRAKYPNGTTETNTVSLSATTSTAIIPLPTITVDTVTLGQFPTFTVSGGLSGYKTEFYFGSTYLGYRMGNGTFKVPSSKPIPNGKQDFTAKVSYGGNQTTITGITSRVKMLQQDKELINPYNRATHGYSSMSVLSSGHYTPRYVIDDYFASRSSTISVGDYNCDGYEDFAIAIPFLTHKTANVINLYSGAVYVYYGSATGLVDDVAPSENPAPGKPFVYKHNMTTSSIESAYTGVGFQVSTGNFNGDINPLTSKSCDDIAVALPYFSDGIEGGPTYEGAVLLLYGSPTYGLRQTSIKKAYYGSPVQCSSGDCYNTVIKPGGYSGYNHSTEGGSVYYGYFGAVLNTSRGDVNNDGYDDLLVTERRQVACASYPCMASDTGVVYLFYGSDCGVGVMDCSNPGLGMAWTRINPPPGAGSAFGTTGTTFGLATTMLDSDNDGFSDLFIGAPRFNSTSDGRIYFIEGKALETKPNVMEKEMDIIDRGLGHNIIPAQYQKTLTYDSATTSDRRFGAFLSNAGDINGDGYEDLLVGDWNDNTSGVTGGGATYVFYGGAGTGEADDGPQVALGYLLNDSNQCAGLNCFIMHYAPSFRSNSTFFGNLVRGIGDFDNDGKSDVVISARYTPSASKPDVGLANVLYSSVTGLKTGGTRFSPSSGDKYDYFGWDAIGGKFRGGAMSDLAVVVGHKDEDADNVGVHIYVYEGTAGGYGSWYSSEPKYKITSCNQGYLDDIWYFANMVFNAGDINGDGYDDLITKSTAYLPNESVGYNNSLIVYYGSENGTLNDDLPSENPVGLQPRLITSTTVKSMGGTLSNYFFHVAPAGDVNGDGFADVVTYTESYAYIFLFYGSGSGIVLSDAPKKVPNSLLAPKIISDTGVWYVPWGPSSYPAILPVHGDINGDGYEDIIFRDTINYNSAGNSLKVVYGSANGIQSDGSLTTGVGGDFVDSGTADDLTGHCTGSGQSLQCRPFRLLDGGTFGFGFVVASLGDVNGDGYDDIMTSEPWVNANQGRIDVYYGSEHGLVATGRTDVDPMLLPLQITGYPNGAYAGYHFSAYAGDINGDGYKDMLVATESGYTYLYYGSASGLITAGGPATNARSCPTGPSSCVPLKFNITSLTGFSYGTGASAAYNGAVGIGDLNMDGYDDVLVRPSPFYKNTSPYSGGAIIFFGSPYGLRADLTPSETYQCNKDAYGGCNPYPIVPDQLTYFNLGDGSTVIPIWGDFDGDGSPDIVLGSSNYHLREDLLAGKNIDKSTTSAKYWVFR